MKHIIGLGNPGTKYKKTRHNLGFMVVDLIIGTEKWKESKNGKLLYHWTEMNDQEVELVKPQTYMNNSGISVAYLKKKHPKMNREDLIVIHDDVDIAFGETKLTLEGSSGGHNGIKSIIEHIGTEEFIRLRIGIGKDDNLPTESHVLRRFNMSESKQLQSIFEKTTKTIEILSTGDIDQAQQFYNTKK